MRSRRTRNRARHNLLFSSAGDDELSSILTKMGGIFNAWHDVLKFQPNVNEMLLHEVLRYELSQIHGMKDLFKRRNAMLAAHAAAQSAQQSLELKQQQFHARGEQGKASKLDSKIASAVDVVRSKKLLLDYMTRGLFFAELDRFTFEKVASFKNMMGLFAAARLAYSNRLSEMWSASPKPWHGCPRSGHRRSRRCRARCSQACRLQSERRNKTKTRMKLLYI